MPFDYFYGKQGGQYAFYRIPKLLFTDSRFETLSTDAKLLYGMLINRTELSLKNGWIDEQGHIIDRAISAANDCGAAYGAVAYKLGLQDGIKLMSELKEIK